MDMPKIRSKMRLDAIEAANDCIKYHEKQIQHFQEMVDGKAESRDTRWQVVMKAFAKMMDECDWKRSADEIQDIIDAMATGILEDIEKELEEVKE